MVPLGHPQTCVHPDVCLGITHVSGKAPLSGQGVWWIHNVSALFALQIPWGERGRYIVYLLDPLSRERGFTRYMGLASQKIAIAEKSLRFQIAKY